MGYPSISAGRVGRVDISDETNLDRHNRENFYAFEAIDDQGVTFRFNGWVPTVDREQRIWFPLHRVRSVVWVPNPNTEPPLDQHPRYKDRGGRPPETL